MTERDAINIIEGVFKTISSYEMQQNLREKINTSEMNKILKYYNYFPMPEEPSSPCGKLCAEKSVNDGSAEAEEDIKQFINYFMHQNKSTGKNYKKEEVPSKEALKKETVHRRSPIITAPCVKFDVKFIDISSQTPNAWTRDGYTAVHDFQSDVICSVLVEPTTKTMVHPSVNSDYEHMGKINIRTICMRAINPRGQEIERVTFVAHDSSRFFNIKQHVDFGILQGPDPSKRYCVHFSII